jgi:hypothetical protein
MRLFGNQALQQDSGNLLSDLIVVRLEEEVEQSGREVVGVRVRKTQLIGNCVEEQVATLGA